jgi:Dyp-type peroxidase family
MSNESEPLLDADDIQGNIIPGFNRKERYLVAFSCTDKGRLQSALALLRPQITRMSEALEHRDNRKRAFLSAMPAPERTDLWVNLALGVGATTALGATGVIDLDDDERSFAKGMGPGIVGDPFTTVLPDGSPNPAARANWKVGSPSRRVDLLLIFANDANVAEAARPVVDEVAQLLGSQPIYQERGWVLSGETEHFGFRDGISQPGVRGRIKQDGAERLVTTRYGVPSQQGIDFGKTGQPLVWPGQFLTGQPVSQDDHPALAPELTNGSFLVFRRLQQDVKAFYDDTDAMAQKLNAATGQALSGSDLRTGIVGRFPSGASLMRHQQEPIQPEGPNEINYFVFGTALPTIALSDGTAVAGSAADPDVLRGRRCPVWAHTRKVNPRDQGTNRGNPVDTIGFQMLRRGIPFGPSYDHSNPASPSNKEPRGLLFLSYQANIARQFEILNHDWMNNRDAPQAGGFDLLVGQNVSDNGLYALKAATFFGASGAGTDFETPNQWVMPTGGAFLFAPSLAFFDKFGAPEVA